VIGDLEKAPAARRPEPDVMLVSCRHTPTVASWSWSPVAASNGEGKKAGVVENPQVLDHAGLLFDRPPEITGLPLV